jgi:hypothetical protein
MLKRDDCRDLNPNAPPELSRFAFLIGAWRCDATLDRGDGTWENLDGLWEGRAILDGYAIADEYRMTGAAGELLVLGVNFRSYDPAKKTWNMKWLNALGGSWIDLGPEELGGVQIDDQGITYCLKEPVAPHVFSRSTYTNISENRFTWRGEKSEDGTAWKEFMVIEAHRIQHRFNTGLCYVRNSLRCSSLKASEKGSGCESRTVPPL